MAAGSGRFERVTSPVCRDASILLAGRIGLYDLHATGADDFEVATASLKTYVHGHIRKDGSYP